MHDESGTATDTGSHTLGAPNSGYGAHMLVQQRGRSLLAKNASFVNDDIRKGVYAGTAPFEDGKI